MRQWPLLMQPTRRCRADSLRSGWLLRYAAAKGSSYRLVVAIYSDPREKEQKEASDKFKRVFDLSVGLDRA
jgi:hypothetical protein